MIITTTMHIENKPVQEYKGIVFGEVVEGRNFVKDFMSGIRDIVGGRSGRKWHAHGHMQWYSRCSLIRIDRWD